MQPLQIIQRDDTDPYFNIATEEFLLMNAASDTFSVYRNPPCVVIGKHQNYAREINHDFIQDEGIPVIRRITGGGTVYHDPGCINFSFILLDRKSNPVDFRSFTRPVIEFLRSRGLNPEFKEKSNIELNGLKISGNSAHVHRDRVLYHGTLLFDSDLGQLERAVSGNEENYNDRSVRSVRRRVTNIKQYLAKNLDPPGLMREFTGFIHGFYGSSLTLSLQDDDRQVIHELVDNRYKTDEWNIGYSPEYRFSRQWNNDEGHFSIEMSSKNGRIHQIHITAPDGLNEPAREFENAVTGKFHDKKHINQAVKKINFVSGKHEDIFRYFLENMF